MLCRIAAKHSQYSGLCNNFHGKIQVRFGRVVKPLIADTPH
jgi:hypothetical protein